MDETEVDFRPRSGNSNMIEEEIAVQAILHENQQREKLFDFGILKRSNTSLIFACHTFNVMFNELFNF